MSVGQVIKDALRVGKKIQQDLADAMGERREEINRRLKMNEVDEEMILATAKITGLPLEDIKSDIEKQKSLSPDLNILLESVEKLNDSLSNLSHDLEKRDIKITGLEKEVKAKEETINSLKETVSSQRETIYDLKLTIEKLRAEAKT